MDIANEARNALDFRELAETCPVAIFQVDAEGRCTYANAFCVRLLDVPEPTGHGWMQAVHPLDQAIAAAMWHRPVDTLGIERVLRLGRQDGPVTHVRVRATPLPAPGGTLRGYAVSAVEIAPSTSKLERLVSANAFLARAEEIAGVGCWRFDIRTRELLWTSNMRRIHELPDDYTPRGDEHVKYFEADTRARLERAVKDSIAGGKPWDVHLPMRTATGREIWVRSVGEPERVDGRVVAVVGVLHDLTQERKRAEELRVARTAADAATRARTQLLARLSHEVRPPLDGIVGNTRQLLDEPLAPPLRHHVDQIQRSAQTLLSRVRDILDGEGDALAPASPSGRAGPGPRQPRVLVVDDNSINQVVAAGLVRKLGCEDVDVVNNGSEAVALAADGRYDLILMDCQMPVMDGYEATRRLRAAGCEALIVAVTANTVTGTRERCLAAGMDDYLTKPISVERLQEALSRCVAGPAPAMDREALRARCVAACERCSSICEAALASDEGYTAPGIEPYSALQLSLVSCSSVCFMVASNLAGELGNAAEMAQWCAQVCHTCHDIVMDTGSDQGALDGVAASCVECAQACEDLAGGLRS